MLAFTARAVALVVLLGLVIALLLNRDFPGRNVVRTLILLPWAIPPVVNGLMCQWIYDSKVGALNGLLVSLGGSWVPHRTSRVNDEPCGGRTRSCCRSSFVAAPVM
jgi:ABC-type sugar transport system permease subunit